MSDKDTAIDLLRSIDGTLKQLVALMRVAKPKEIASDRLLDSQYGNPEVKTMPRDWMGDNFSGCRMSECPAGLLDMVAERYDYYADKAEQEGATHNGKPLAPYKRMDAAKARGWAARVRAGRVAPASNGNGHSDAGQQPPAMLPDPALSSQLTDDDIPF